VNKVLVVFDLKNNMTVYRVNFIPKPAWIFMDNDEYHR